MHAIEIFSTSVWSKVQFALFYKSNDRSQLFPCFSWSGIRHIQDWRGNLFDALGIFSFWSGIRISTHSYVTYIVTFKTYNRVIKTSQYLELYWNKKSHNILTYIGIYKSHNIPKYIRTWKKLKYVTKFLNILKSKSNRNKSQYSGGYW